MGLIRLLVHWTMAYKLDVLGTSRFYHVFHVSCLKKVVGLKCIVQTKLPELDEEDSIWLQLEAIRDTREYQLWHHTVKDVLYQWKIHYEKVLLRNLPPSCSSFHAFNLKDRAIFQGGRHVRV